MKKAVFLDRDGVINDNTLHVNKPTDLILYPWTARAIRKLNEAGFQVFVVTNQGGIEMGYFTHKDLEAVHQHMLSLLKAENAIITDIAYCPHFNQKCTCRKPKPGMLLTLADKYAIDLSTSWMVGDFPTDIEAGIKAGCKTIKIGQPDPRATYSCKNLEQTVEYILSHSFVDTQTN